MINLFCSVQLGQGLTLNLNSNNFQISTLIPSLKHTEPEITPTEQNLHNYKSVTGVYNLQEDSGGGEDKIPTLRNFGGVNKNLQNVSKVLTNFLIFKISAA